MFGTFVSVLGGGFIGFLVGITLILENGECGIGWKPVLMDCLIWGLIGGGFGSLVCSRADIWDMFVFTVDQVDSLLGATVQLSRYSKEKKVILQDDSREETAQIISGIKLLTNNQVWPIYFKNIE